jgi:hypothetical protein
MKILHVVVLRNSYGGLSSAEVGSGEIKNGKNTRGEVVATFQSMP